MTQNLLGTLKLKPKSLKPTQEEPPAEQPFKKPHPMHSSVHPRFLWKLFCFLTGFPPCSLATIKCKGCQKDIEIRNIAFLFRLCCFKTDTYTYLDHIMPTVPCKNQQNVEP